MTLSIHAASSSDADTIARFVRELAIYEREPSAVEATAEAFRAQLASPAPPFAGLIAEWNGVAAGMALYYFTYSTWRGMRGLHLEDLYVAPAHRRRGVARALVARLCRIVRSEGYGRLEWNVLEWNDLALGFYHAIGGHPQSDWRLYRMREDAIDRLAALVGAGTD